MKFNKYETNLLLNKIRENNKIYGLILETQYIYARNIGEVAELKMTDINLEDMEITFQLFNDNRRQITFMLHERLYSDYSDLITGKKENDYIFEDFYEVDKIRPLLNFYLYNKTPKLDDSGLFKGKNLTTQDFRILRGQHLYLDNVDIKTINQLYQHKNIESTKKLIDYNNLKKRSDSLDDVFENYTCLDLFHDSEFDDYENYYVTYKNEEAYVLVSHVNDTITVDGSNTIKEKFNCMEDVYSLLCRMKNQGDYIVFDDLVILKN